MAKEAEEAAPRRSSRQREKRKIADEAELAAEEAAPKVAKKQAGAKKQPKKEKKNQKNVAAEAAKESKHEEDSLTSESANFGPETQELPGSQESQSSASEGLPVPDLPICDLYPKSSQEQTDTDSDGMNFTNNKHSRTKNVISKKFPLFSEESATAKVEPAGMFKIATWNVAGLYAAIKKEFCKTVKTLDCDVLCLQETKLSLKKPPPAEIAEQLKSWKYRTYANSEAKAGYSGTAILSKTKVKNLALRNLFSPRNI